MEASRLFNGYLACDASDDWESAKVRISPRKLILATDTFELSMHVTNTDARPVGPHAVLLRIHGRRSQRFTVRFTSTSERSTFVKHFRAVKSASCVPRARAGVSREAHLAQFGMRTHVLVTAMPDSLSCTRLPAADGDRPVMFARVLEGSRWEKRGSAALVLPTGGVVEFLSRADRDSVFAQIAPAMRKPAAAPSLAPAPTPAPAPAPTVEPPAVRAMKTAIISDDPELRFLALVPPGGKASAPGFLNVLGADHFPVHTFSLAAGRGLTADICGDAGLRVADAQRSIDVEFIDISERDEWHRMLASTGQAKRARAAAPSCAPKLPGLPSGPAVVGPADSNCESPGRCTASLLRDELETNVAAPGLGRLLERKACAARGSRERRKSAAARRGGAASNARRGPPRTKGSCVFRSDSFGKVAFSGDSRDSSRSSAAPGATNEEAVLASELEHLAGVLHSLRAQLGNTPTGRERLDALLKPISKPRKKPAINFKNYCGVFS